MSVTPIGEWKRDKRKTVTLSSGRVAVIRKLMQRDFVVKGLVMLSMELGRELTNDETQDYMSKNPDEAMAMEDTMLIRGVVSPRLTLDVESKGAVYLFDLDSADRKELVQHLMDFSAITTAVAVKSDEDGRAHVEGAGADGEVLQDPSE
jgi:hypothetical protein